MNQILCMYLENEFEGCLHPAEVVVSTDRTFFICKEHDLFCWACGQQATHGCSLHGCKEPMCDNPKHDHNVFHRGWSDPMRALEFDTDVLTCRNCKFWTIAEDMETYGDICPRCNQAMETISKQAFLRGENE